MQEKHYFIRDDIQLDFPIPTTLQKMIDEAEALDKAHNYEFMCVADMIDVTCKGYYRNGKLTKDQWDLITAKYSVNAIGNSEK